MYAWICPAAVRIPIIMQIRDPIRIKKFSMMFFLLFCKYNELIRDKKIKLGLIIPVLLMLNSH